MENKLKGLKKEFETAMVNKPSVFERLKFYCIKIEVYLKVNFLVPENLLTDIARLRHQELKCKENLEMYPSYSSLM